jgi:MYXO-CTERM domain-containing protein
MARSLVSLLAASAVLTWGAVSSAHVRFVSPQPRHATPGNQASSAMIKTGPCGCSTMECPNGDVRDPARVTVLEPGATIEVRFKETIDHPGFYRISFDQDGQDAFVPPPLARSSIQMGTPTLPVLKDNIPDTGDEDYSTMITLPNVECENCTLQLIQVMSSGQTWAASDIYYTCADIALRRSGGAGAGGMGSGGMSSGGMAGMSAGGMSSGGMSSGGMSSGGASAGTAGSAGAGGAGAGGAATGGAGSGAGGLSASGGAGMATGAGAGGAAAGMPGTGGGPTAGAPATGGVGTGGVGTAGSVATGGTATTPPADDGGCACSTAPRAASAGWLALGAAALATALNRRARRRR